MCYSVVGILQFVLQLFGKGGKYVRINLAGRKQEDLLKQDN